MCLIESKAYLGIIAINMKLGIIVIIKVLLAWVNWGKHGIHVVGMKLDLCKIWQEY